MLGEQAQAVGPTHVLVIRGGDPVVIRAVLEALGARVDSVLPGAPTEAAAGAPTAPASAAPEAPMSSTRLDLGNLVLDLSAHEVTLGGLPLPCTLTEFGLLTCLAERPGQVFSRRQLLLRLRERADFLTERTVDTHVGNLRRKLTGAGGSDVVIETVRGVGYRLRVLVQPPQTPRLRAVPRDAADEPDSA